MKKLLLLSLLLFAVWGALPSEEAWYLISEAELSSIERWKASSETERQSWLSQAHTLRAQAERLNARAANLQADSERLNRQSAAEREKSAALAQSFSAYEQDQSRRASLMSGEIAGLKESLAAEKLTSAKYKSRWLLLLTVIIALGALAALCIAFRLAKVFRINTL